MAAISDVALSSNADVAVCSFVTIDSCTCVSFVITSPSVLRPLNIASCTFWEIPS